VEPRPTPGSTRSRSRCRRRISPPTRTRRTTSRRCTTASDLDLSRLEASLGFGWQISDRLALVGDFRYVDLGDDAPYLEDLTGTLFSWSAALRWRF
jgi:hypothetical protein